MSCKVEGCFFRNSIGCKLFASTKNHIFPPDGFAPPTKEQLLAQLKNTPGIETCQKSEALTPWVNTCYKFYDKDAQTQDVHVEDRQGTVDFNKPS